MKPKELEHLIEEAGMTPEFFCELVEDGDLKRYINRYHQYHQDELRKDKLQPFKFYPKKTSALVAIKRIPEQEIKTLAEELKKQPHSNRKKYQELEEQNQQIKAAFQDLKIIVKEADQETARLTQEVKTLRAQAIQTQEYQEQAKLGITYLESLYSLIKRTFTDNASFPEESREMIFNFLTEAADLSTSYSK